MKYDLSYTMQRKSDKLIEYSKQLKQIKDRITNKSMPIILYIAITGILALLCINNFSDHFESIISFSGTSIQLTLKDYLLLITFIISGGVSYFKFKSNVIINKREQELTKKYNTLRLDIIDNINHDFCKCNINCNCKESFIKIMMNTYNIDLIFKN